MAQRTKTDNKTTGNRRGDRKRTAGANLALASATVMALMATHPGQAAAPGAPPLPKATPGAVSGGPAGRQAQGVDTSRVGATPGARQGGMPGMTPGMRPGGMPGMTPGGRPGMAPGGVGTTPRQGVQPGMRPGGAVGGAMGGGMGGAVGTPGAGARPGMAPGAGGVSPKQSVMPGARPQSMTPGGAPKTR